MTGSAFPLADLPRMVAALRLRGAVDLGVVAGRRLQAVGVAVVLERVDRFLRDELLDTDAPLAGPVPEDERAGYERARRDLGEAVARVLIPQRFASPTTTNRRQRRQRSR